MTAVAIPNTIYKVNIGGTRYVCVDGENDVHIYDESNGKLAYFTG